VKDPLHEYEATILGLNDYYGHRTVFGRGDKPSQEQIIQAIGECQTMIGSLLRAHNEYLRFLSVQGARR